MKKFIKQLEAKQKKMAALRDELRNLENEISYHADKCESAYEDLQRAIEALSELV